jgi:hypothetical protein
MVAMPPGTASSGWKVVSQQETMGLDPMGRAVEGIKVYFQTERGLSGSVFVPKADYNLLNVKAAIQDAVGMLHTVHDLKG